MRLLPQTLTLTVLFCASHAYAGTAEVREVARLNNCAPKKIEIYQQKLGNGSQTIYRVECLEPKTVSENTPKMPTTMLVQCDGNICNMLRSLENKSP